MKIEGDVVIEIHSKKESEAVQKELFKLGYSWESPLMTSIQDHFDACSNLQYNSLCIEIGVIYYHPKDLLWKNAKRLKASDIVPYMNTRLWKLLNGE